MELFSRKTLPLVGLDISTSSVKVLELAKAQNQYRVERFAVEPLPQNAIVERAIADVEQVATTVDRAIKRSGAKTKRVALAVGASQAISKTLRLRCLLRRTEMSPVFASVTAARPS